MDRPQISTVVSGRCFPWSRCGIATQSGQGLLAANQSTGTKWAITFDPTVGSPSKFCRSFRTPFSLEEMWNRYSVRRSSLCSEPEFRFERTITLIQMLDCPQIFTGICAQVFLGVDVESLLGERTSLRSRPEFRYKKAINFDPTVGSPLNFYRSFQTPFSLECMWNCYSVRRRSLRSGSVYKFERAIILIQSLDRLQIFTGVYRRRFP